MRSFLPFCFALFMLPVAFCVAGEANELTKQIDALAAKKWNESGVTPAKPASDEQFVRRVYLDLVGRIPTPAERQTFLDDDRKNKREHLVDLLLGSEDYAQHFADVFDVLLMGRGTEKNYRERQNSGWRKWIERVFRENKPWDQVTRDILLARPESREDNGVTWFLYERNNDHQKIAEAIAPAFFGIRIECAQCHDHMVATEIEQKHYWGLVAFFNRGKNKQTKVGPRVAESAIGGFSEFANLEGGSSPNLLTFFEAKTVDEKRPAAKEKQEDRGELYVPAKLEGGPRVPKFSRREAFANEIANGHPLIARAFANRIWALLLGRGIVHPFDEMDSMHPPSHPELLDLLAEEFRKSNHDIRRLVKAIALSRAYQLDSKRPTGVDDPATFAWYLERPLTAEQLARSALLAVKGEFKNDDPLFGKLRKPVPDVMPETITTDITETLFLANNKAINELVVATQNEKHLVSRIQKQKSFTKQNGLAYLTLFGRAAFDDELQRIQTFLEAEGKDQQSSRHRWQQVIWAMLTSAEFRFNH